ncbi:MAG: hypothetical protein ACE5PM_06135 [Candidatus Hydrothermarchaeales archaeon]
MNFLVFSAKNVLALFNGFSAIYFAIATVLAYMNYQRTDHSGFWFHLIVAMVICTLASMGNSVRYIGVLSNETGNIVEVLLGVVTAVLFFTATYTLTKKHHLERVF